MRIPWRDSLATLFVAAAVGIYAAWLVGSALPGLGTPAPIAVAVLALGVAASASAVVPGFGDLLRGSKAYLAASSLLGLVALIAGVWTLVAGEAYALATLLGATIVLWGMSSVRHLMTHSLELRLQHR